jgi:hypothetical protein
MIDKLLAKFGYFHEETLRGRLLYIIAEIRQEIDNRPQYSNIGKKGCLMRIQRLYDELFKP